MTATLTRSFRVSVDTGRLTIPVPRVEPVRAPAAERPAETDRCGRRRSAATYPEFRKGQKPANAGKTYPPQILTPDEIAMLMDACPDTRPWRRMKALIAVGYRSGLRVSELLGLEPHHARRRRLEAGARVCPRGGDVIGVVACLLLTACAVVAVLVKEGEREQRRTDRPPSGRKHS